MSNKKSSVSSSLPAIKAALFDLDGTLFDNLATRHKAVLPALRFIGLKGSDKAVLNKYEQVVDLGDAFEAVGLPNFKHEWSSPALYALLTILYGADKTCKVFPKITANESALFTDIFCKVQKSLGRIPYENKEKYFRTCAQINAKEEVKKFKKLFQSIKKDDFFTGAQAVYTKSLNFKLYKNAETCIENLSKQGIRCYIVSEGLSSIQRMKIENTGLSRLFKGKICITQDAEEPKGSKRILKTAKRLQAKKELKSLSAHEQKLLNTVLPVQKMLLKYGTKSSPEFYHRVLSCISVAPDNPERALRDLKYFQKAQEGLSITPVKAAMTGDRYDKDLLPLMRILKPGKVVTVRMLQGKHIHTSPKGKIARRFRPDLTTADFKQVEKFLLDNNTWKSISPVWNFPAAPVREIDKILTDTLRRIK